MKKIRINELARELEVKPGVILDMLPELGVQEKKTHSSSIDEDVALIVKERLTGNVADRGSVSGTSPRNGHIADHDEDFDQDRDHEAQAPAAPAPLEARAAAGAPIPEPL